jgi:hypothetical protein
MRNLLIFFIYSCENITFNYNILIKHQKWPKVSLLSSGKIKNTLFSHRTLKKSIRSPKGTLPKSQITIKINN